MCAFPYLGEANFEDGTDDIFDTETDNDGKLTFPSYKTLATDPRIKVAPFRGAYCMMVDLAVSATDAYITETATFDTSADEEVSFGFYLYVSPDITMANNDVFTIFRLLASATDEGSVAIKYTTAAGLQIGLVTPSETDAYTSLPKNQWVHVSVDAVIDAGGGNDGTLTLYIDGTSVGSQATIDQGAITDANLGVMDQDSGTTKGVLLFDSLVVDDTSAVLARVYPNRRWEQNFTLTKSGHAFVGPGTLDCVTLRDGGSADCVLEVWDTDKADTNVGSPVAVLRSAVANQVLATALPARLNRGCYISMSGTSPRATLQLGSCAAWGSDGAVRSYGLRAPA